MATKKVYKLDLMAVLQAIDQRNLHFYSSLTEGEKSGYVPLVLMRYISSLTDQNKNAAYAVLATNDLVKIGFWNLTKHPELQHLLLCLAGLGSKQYRPWLSAKRTKKTFGKIDEWLMEIYPDINEDELDIIKSSYELESWKSFVAGSGLSDKQIKELVDAWKKQKND